MSSVALNLIWKEARELKWVVLSSLAVALAAPLYYVVQDPQLGWYWVELTLFIYPVLAGVFFGMRAAAGERASRTAALLAALPVRPQVLGLIKILITSVGVLIPVMLLTLLGFAVRPLADLNMVERESLWTISGVSAACTMHIMLIIAAFGTGAPTEILAAARGIAAVAVWFVAAIILRGYYPDEAPTLVYVICGLGPPLEWFGAANSLDDSWFEWGGSLRFVLVPLTALALAAGFVARYKLALAPIAERWRFRWPVRLWAPRLPLPLAALAWKQLREAAPFSVLVLLAVTMFAGACGLVTAMHDRSRSPAWPVVTISVFAQVACVGGLVLALLIGVGTFAADLERRVNTFWRSRPISASQWFWTKYTVGLSTLIVTLVAPPALALSLFVGVFYEPNRRPLVPIVLWVILAWFGIFSAAVSAICLVRHTIYAAILTIGLVVASFTVVSWWDRALFTGVPLATPLQDAAIWFLAALACTAVGWWAAVRDVAVFE